MKLVVIFFVVLKTFSGNAELHTAPYAVSRMPDVIPDKGINPRIYGGGEAPEGKFPYMVFVLMRNESGGLFRCSASLVEKNWVLLAAHCISKGVTNNDFILAGGKAKLQSYLNVRMYTPFESVIAEPLFGVEERRISGFYVHPKYDEINLHYDIALLRLKTPFSENVKVLNKTTDNDLKVKNCTLLGWGLIGGGHFSGNLNYIEGQELKSTSTGCQYKTEGPFWCLEHGQSGICEGDSGSPLVCGGKIWGVASHYVTVDENRNCENSLEEYYADVRSSWKWIEQTMKSGCKMQAVRNTIIIALGILIKVIYG